VTYELDPDGLADQRPMLRNASLRTQTKPGSYIEPSQGRLIQRDAYLRVPPRMTDTFRASLTAAGLAPEYIHERAIHLLTTRTQQLRSSSPPRRPRTGRPE
jgi:hypothetical protein